MRWHREGQGFNKLFFFACTNRYIEGRRCSLLLCVCNVYSVKERVSLLFIAKNVQKRARECNYPRPVSYFVFEREREREERERDQ